MIYQLLITFLLLIAYIGVIMLSELLHKRFGVSAEITRKLAHLLASLSSIVFLFLIDSHWYILILGIFFFVLLFIGRRLMFFKSIESVKRKTGGSYLLPVSIYLLFMLSDVFNNSLYFVLPIIILGISDTLAGYFGEKYSSKTRWIMLGNYNLQKTYLGSFVFLLSSLVISFVVLYFYGYVGSELLFLAILFSVATTLTEVLSSWGSDNLTIPMVSALFIWLNSL